VVFGAAVFGAIVATTVRVGGGLSGTAVVAAPPALMTNIVAAVTPRMPMTVIATIGHPLLCR
jgi:hypothetical protein